MKIDRINKLKLLLSDFKTMHDECEDYNLCKAYMRAYEAIFKLIELEYFETLNKVIIDAMSEKERKNDKDITAPFSD